MPPVRTRESHRWTNFELQAMLALVAKGVHLEEHGHRNNKPGFEKMNAYDRFATLLNEAVHGKYNYAHDIDKKEIFRMLDQLLVDRMHVIGKGGLLERQLGGRITRSLSLAWNRNSKLNFNGSLTEWNNGRREKVMKEYMIKKGLLPAELEPVKEVNMHEPFAVIPYPEIAPTPNPYISSSALTTTEKSKSRQNAPASADDYLMRQMEKSRAAAKATTVRSSKWRGKQSALSAAYTHEAHDEDIVMPVGPETINSTSEPVNTKLDSFSGLPEKLKGTEKYDWAKPGASPPITQAAAPKLKRPGINASRSDTKRTPAKKVMPPSNFFSGGSVNTGNVTLANFGVNAPDLINGSSSPASFDVKTPEVSFNGHARIYSSDSMNTSDFNYDREDAFENGLEDDGRYSFEQDEYGGKGHGYNEEDVEMNYGGYS